ncbi:hypothetical protein V6N13_054250 [Hibiscus sabdariffa]|uniref:Uncharacterized protein n=1 Tax=Hibiscus sabdariffa TaxID=183260 RepID=A0ABR2DYD8_9ROSI
MAMEAPNMNLFPPQFMPNGGTENLYNTQINTCISLAETLQEVAVFQSLCKTSINRADSGVTYNMNFPVSALRKRPRDVLFDSFSVSRNNKFSGVSSIVVDDDVVSQIQQQHRQEIDHLIAQHFIEAESKRIEEKARLKDNLGIHAKAIQLLLVCNGRMLRIRAPCWGRMYCRTESYMLRHRTDLLFFVHNEEWEAESSQVGDKLPISLSSMAIFS